MARKQKGTSANHLLNFSLPERPKLPTFVSSPSDYRRTILSSFYSKERFLQANFQFVVAEDFFDEQDADQILKWEQLKLVIFSTDQEYQCPICLDYPIAPKITKCGHIFCWTCLLRFFEATFPQTPPRPHTSQTQCPGGTLEVSQCYKQCPICTEMISLYSLKDVTFLSQHHYREADQIQFQLVLRHRQGTVVRPAELVFDSSHIPHPYYKEPSARFSRFQLDLPHHQVEREILESLLRDLPLPESDQSDSEQHAYLVARTLTENLLSDLPHAPVEKNELPESFGSPITPSVEDSLIPHFFGGGNGQGESNSAQWKDLQFCFQESGGAKIFLHPLCVRALQNQYGAFPQMPFQIEGKILELEELTLDEATRKRHKFLAHLPLFSVCYLCEIDMRGLVSKQALGDLIPKFKARQRHREKQKRIDEAAKRLQNVRLCETENAFAEAYGFEPIPVPASDVLIDFCTSSSPPSVPRTWVPNANKKGLSSVMSSRERVLNPPATRVVVALTPAQRAALAEEDFEPEERRAPSYSQSFSEALNNLSIQEVESTPQGGGKRGRKNQRKKQLLFSTSQRPHF